MFNAGTLASVSGEFWTDAKECSYSIFALKAHLAMTNRLDLETNAYIVANCLPSMPVDDFACYLQVHNPCGLPMCQHFASNKYQ
jgi:hypothetical protein